MSEEIVTGKKETKSQSKLNELMAEHFGQRGFGPQHHSYLIFLQFFNVVWGIEQVEGEELFQDINEERKLKFKRRSHDFIRRLIAPDTKERYEASWKSRKEDFPGEPAEVLEVLAKVFKSLLVNPRYWDTNNRLSRKKFFLPYFGELIHHDYAHQRSNAETEESEGYRHERVDFRGGGTLVYELLRMDECQERKAEVKDGLRELVEDRRDSLGNAAKLLSESDAIKADEWTDPSYMYHDPKRETIWCENLREGTHRILGADIARERKVSYLMQWLPFCLAKHMLALATPNGEPVVAIDVGAGTSPFRQVSQRQYQRDRNSFRRKFSDLARDKAESSGDPDDIELSNILDSDDVSTLGKTVQTLREFYRRTMVYVGALNANSGVQHYTLDLPLLEAIVYATVDQEMPFGDFCSEVLYSKLGMIVDKNSAYREEGFIDDVENRDLEKNEEGLVRYLDTLGLIKSFSDATKMVTVVP